MWDAYKNQTELCIILVTIITFWTPILLTPLDAPSLFITIQTIPVQPQSSRRLGWEHSGFSVMASLAGVFRRGWKSTHLVGIQKNFTEFQLTKLGSTSYSWPDFNWVAAPCKLYNRRIKKVFKGWRLITQSINPILFRGLRGALTTPRKLTVQSPFQDIEEAALLTWKHRKLW